MTFRNGDVVRVVSDTPQDWSAGTSPHVEAVGVVVDQFEFDIPGSRTKAVYYTVRMFADGTTEVVFESRLEKLNE